MTDSKVFLHTNSKSAALLYVMATLAHAKTVNSYFYENCFPALLISCSYCLIIYPSVSHIQVSNFYFLKISKKFAHSKPDYVLVLYTLYVPFYSVLYVTLMIMKHTNKKNIFLN